jgi:hypothetical protein
MHNYLPVLLKQQKVISTTLPGKYSFYRSLFL